MIFLLTFMLLTNSPVYVEDRVDLIEVNYVYQGKSDEPTFRHCIYYKWKRTNVFKPIKGQIEFDWGYEVVDWRNFKATGLPQKNHKTKRWEQVFWDEKDQCYRKIIAKSCEISESNYDVEIEARKSFSASHRVGLKKNSK